MTENKNVLITGAAGTVGGFLREGLRGQFARLRLSDHPDNPPAPAGAEGEEVLNADLRDMAAVRRAAQGMDTIIHLGGISREDKFDKILDVNISGMHNLMEAARLEGVQRVIFASSVHAVGFYPRSVTVSPDLPTRADTYYGASKVFAEALGQMYWYKYGLEFVAVRIYSCLAEPENERHLSSWLSPRDAAQLFTRAVTAPDVGYLTLAGISDNTRKWVTKDGWDAIGYRPEDNAEIYAGAVTPEEADPSDPATQFHGGEFVRRGFTDQFRPAEAAEQGG